MRVATYSQGEYVVRGEQMDVCVRPVALRHPLALEWFVNIVFFPQKTTVTISQFAHLLWWWGGGGGGGKSADKSK